MEYHAKKAYGGTEVELQAFLDLGTRWRQLFRLKFRPLYFRYKIPDTQINRRLGGPSQAVW
jgi:hypothetical protein